MGSRSRTPLDDLVAGWTAPHQPGCLCGGHLCLLYETEAEQHTVLASFLRQSLQEGCQVIYLAQTRAPEEVRRYLHDEDEDWAAWLASGQLRIADTFLRPGTSEPDQMLAFLRAETERALAQGYAGLCVTSELPRALHGSPGSDRLIDCEAKLNAFLPGSRCLVLCQYDRRRSTPELLLQVLSTHPLAMLGTTLYDNSYYVPPEELPSDHGAAATLRRCLEHLVSREQTETALRRSRDEWESTFHGMSDAISIHDVEYNILNCNQAFAQLFPTGAAASVKCYELVHGLQAPPAFCPLARMLGSRKSETHEFFEPSIGRHLSVRTDPVLDAAGEVHRVIHVVRDVTERRQTEAALQETQRDSRQRQAQISALLEGSRALLQFREFPQAARAIFDSCKNLLDASTGYVALLSPEGTENEVLFLDPGGLRCTVDPSLPMPIRGLRARAYDTGQTLYENDFHHSEWLRFLPAGHVGLENVLFAPLKIDGRTVGLLGLANKPGGFTPDDAHTAGAFGDLAAVALLNSRMWDSLEEQEQRFRSVVQTAADAIVSVDSPGRIAYWNPAAETMFGYAAEEVIGRPLTLLIPERLHAAHHRGFQRFLSTMPSSIPGTIREVTGLRKDGSEFPLELSVAAWKSRDGVFFTALCRDITARRRAEQEIWMLHRHLEHHAARLAAANQELEAFSYSVSHDLRAPLRHMDGFSEALLEEYGAGLPEQARHYLDRIRTGTRQMAALVDGLLSLSRVGRREISPRVTGLQPLVEEVLADLQPELAGRSIEWRIGSLPALECDPALMKQVFANLLSNAVKYSRPRERAVIEVGARNREDASPVVFVRDNGVGFSMQYADKLFGTFQRLHRSEDFEGAGIGLATVQRIIHRHGGQVWAEAEVDGGATFYFTLDPAPGAVTSCAPHATISWKETSP